MDIFSKEGEHMAELLWGLTTKVSLIFLVIFIFSSTKIFMKIIHNRKFTLRDKIIASMVFGFMGIIGTYSGIPYMGAIVNNRMIGVVFGGLIGGPFVGVLSGLIAGGHRFLIDMGGFTALSCGVSTAVEGLIAGLISPYFFRSKNRVVFGFLTGIITETVQMMIILLIAKPFADAFSLVSVISFPMVLTNSIGIALMIIIYENMIKINDMQGAFRSEQALRIARETMKYLRMGLTIEASQNVVRIIRDIAKVDAVAITDRERIFAYEGIDSLGFKVGDYIHSSITKQAMEQHIVISSLLNVDLKLKKNKNLSVVIAPLIVNGEAIGSIKLYSFGKTKTSMVDEELASGLAMLFSTQLELSHLDEQKHLLNKAELSVLQAKINPHFLFNALNTIHSLIRIEPNQARELLVKFSDYFRNNIIHNGCFITLEKELDQVMAYLELEKARFGTRLIVEFDVPEQLDIEVPPLIIQPLIENAIKHGIFEHKSSGKVKIMIKACDTFYEISIEDDGVGIDENIIGSIYRMDETTNCIGLMTTHKRLLATYKNNKGLYFESKPGNGTLVSFSIPRGEKV